MTEAIYDAGFNSNGRFYAASTGLLGMIRTLAIEGAKPGWRVNIVAGGHCDTNGASASSQLFVAASSTTNTRPGFVQS